MIPRSVTVRASRVVVEYLYSRPPYFLMLREIAKRAPPSHPLPYRLPLLLGDQSLLWVHRSCCLGLAVEAVVEGVSGKPIMSSNIPYPERGVLFQTSLTTFNSWSSYRWAFLLGHCGMWLWEICCGGGSGVRNHYAMPNRHDAHVMQ